MGRLTTYDVLRKHCRKLVSFLRRDFNSSKCKTWARMTTARIKLLRNKRESLVHQMRRDVALLLQSRQDATARIRVEHVIREQNMMAANEIIELFCERIVTRLSIIAKQRDCPNDLKEAISSLIFAAPRCSDVPELLAIRDIFRKKYGNDFVSAATDLRPDSGVNRLLVEKLSSLNPPGELKLKVIKEIAKEYQVQWDTTDTEAELLKPPQDRLEGPRTFVSAASLPLSAGVAPYREAPEPTTRLSSGGNGKTTDTRFQDVASAAKAAADSAKNAVAAAQAAAQLAQTGSLDAKDQNINAPNSGQYDRSNVSLSPHSQNNEDNMGRYNRSQSLGVGNNYSQNGGLDDADDMCLNTRRASYNVRRVHSDIMFDESDCDEENTSDMHRTISGVSSKTNSGVSPSVHPKLPDYDAIAARFEQLKYPKT